MTRPLVSTTADYTIRDQERMKLAANYFAWQYRLTEPYIGQRVLEIGCGVGTFTNYLRDRAQVISIDVASECIAHHQNEFKDHAHIQSLVLDVLDSRFQELKDSRPDSIVCLNVLEHVEDDVQALKHMSAVLPEGGRVLLIVPAFQSLYGAIDRLLGHYRRYTKKSLRITAEQAGFRPEALHYMNSIGFFGWWVNSHILRRTEQSESQILFFDRRLVPGLSTLEGLIAPPFGQSLFAVLAKN